MNEIFKTLFWLVTSGSQSSSINLKLTVSCDSTKFVLFRIKKPVRKNLNKKKNKIYLKTYFLQHGACFWDLFLHIFFHLLFFLFQCFLLFFHFFIHGLVCLFFSEITDCGCNGSCWWRSGHTFLNKTRCEVYRAINYSL